MKAKDVFVVGGLPVHTYNPRTARRLESTVADYLDGANKLLAITGPTKSGKTVLLKHVLRDSDVVWVPAGIAVTEDDLWHAILERTETLTSNATTQQRGATNELTAGLDVSVGVPGSGMKFSLGAKKGESTGASATGSRTSTPKMAALRALGTLRRPLVIDDFHYLDREVQGRVVRALKDLVFDGLPVILVAIPHRRFDSIRVEREMTARVEYLPIPSWSNDELLEIPEVGFPLLGVVGGGSDYVRLATEAFGSPHLMQEFCLRVCKDAQVSETKIPEIAFPSPDWLTFFQKAAKDLARPTFEKLATGPRQRSDRIQRQFKDGSTGDIYLAVLIAIAHAAEHSERIPYVDIRSELSHVLLGAVPQLHEVVRVCEKLLEIARADALGPPVIDFDKEDNVVFITDPYFAFYLKWAIKGKTPATLAT